MLLLPLAFKTENHRDELSATRHRGLWPLAAPAGDEMRQGGRLQNLPVRRTAGAGFPRAVAGDRLKVTTGSECSMELGARSVEQAAEKESG